jgi:SAM-dependent methyltransferase
MADKNPWKVPSKNSAEASTPKREFAESRLQPSIPTHDGHAAPDFLDLHLRSLPYFRAILRAVEASYYQDFELPRPILDIGSGDGHFASLTFSKKLDVGLDPWAEPMPEAKTHGAYSLLVQADGGQMPFPDNHFGSAISNSVLEHIEHIDSVLVEARRVLQPGAPLLFCVPNPDYLTKLDIPNLLKRLRLPSLGRKYTAWFKRMSRVYHADGPDVWQGRLERAGFELVEWWHYFSPAAMHALEWGHYFGVPSLLAKKLTGRWLLAPTRWNLALTRRMVEKYASAAHIPDGTFTFFVARKTG